LERKIHSPDRETIYYAAAGWTIAWYLRKDIQSPDVDGFFDATGEVPVSGNDTRWQQHVNRAILVAETLFLLRSSPGFEEQRKRLVERPLRSAFFEMLAAKQFLKAGFQISARPELNRRGEDFDFTARRAGDMVVNVEVTALTGKEPSQATVLNALRNKRRQLPKSAPGIVYCVIPESWSDAAINWDDYLQSIADRFFRDTTTVNVVVFWMEHSLAAAKSPT
jgi:Holliday junction resolvase-like predicted endonuclease